MSTAESAQGKALDGCGTPNVRLCGLFVRKECWRLSGRGWLVSASTLLLAGIILILDIHPFLAEMQRVDSKTLVVEGWVHQYAIAGAVKEFRTGSYERVFTTGGPVEGMGGYINDYQTEASVGANLLKAAGIPSGLVQMVPSHVNGRDRTYSSAVALRDWFCKHNMSVPSINVLTEDAHARRTRLLFQEAFGKDVQVGIISVPNPDYDAKHWWRYSEGVREVIGEGIAYIYAKCFFWPAKVKN